MAAVQYYGTGRRKTSTARVFLRPGAGAISVNHRTFEAFFPPRRCACRFARRSCLTETADKFDILATVGGGGVSGQAGAVRLGIARALVEHQRRVAQAAQERRLADPRRARQGTQELRNGWSAEALPVQQALKEREGGFLAATVDEGSARGWRSFRPPDQAVEPEDEGIHLRRTQRHLHH